VSLCPSFLTFALPILSPVPLRGVNKQLCGCLAAGWGQPTTHVFSVPREDVKLDFENTRTGIFIYPII